LDAGKLLCNTIQLLLLACNLPLFMWEMAEIAAAGILTATLVEEVAAAALT